MKVNPTWMLVAIMLVVPAGCHKAGPPSKVQNDVAEAQDSAAQSEAKADKKAGDSVAAANADVAVESQKADIRAANAAYDVAMANADGDHNFAVAKCEALSGGAQKACLDHAGAARDMARSRAEAAKADHT
ncbi:MAG TPA: hypothetical protein VK820_04435 [Steroidobacteraceae bacterium]|nr:hypothetical protein [Steroidobacteraceae bacterium]